MGIDIFSINLIIINENIIGDTRTGEYAKISFIIGRH